MIGFLRGRVIENSEETLILDVGGVGYELTCSTNTLSDLVGRDEAKVWVHTHLREDALVLFGFSTPLEKRMFHSLIQVNGVGPKMAVKILSGASISHLVSMIDRGDVKGLSGLPKVGKKTAEQLILTLKGKLVLSEDEIPQGAKAKKASAVDGFGPIHTELVSALVNLGFRSQDVEKVVGGFPVDIDLQQGIRQGLQALAGQP